MFFRVDANREKKMLISINDVQKKNASKTSGERNNLLWSALTIGEGTTTKIPKKTYK